MSQQGYVSTALMTSFKNSVVTVVCVELGCVRSVCVERACPTPISAQLPHHPQQKWDFAGGKRNFFSRFSV